MTTTVRPGSRAEQSIARSVSPAVTADEPDATPRDRADAATLAKLMDELHWLAYAANPFIEKSGGPPASPFGGGIAQEPVGPAVVAADLKSMVEVAEATRKQNYLRLLASLEQEVREAMEKYSGSLTPTEAKKMLERIVMERCGEHV